MSPEIAMANYGIISGMVMPILLFPYFIISSFNSLLIPEFSGYNATKNYTKINNTTQKIFKLISLFSMATIGFFFIFAEEISQLFYNNTQVALYIKILSPLIILMYLDSVVDAILKGLDKQLDVMGCNILDLFVSIICIYILLPIWGIGGYIAVIYISEFLNTSISINQLTHISNFKINLENWIIKPCIGIILAGLFISLFNFSYSLTVLIFEAVMFIAFYILFLIASKCI